jgi:hypothetical protein
MNGKALALLTTCSLCLHGAVAAEVNKPAQPAASIGAKLIEVGRSAEGEATYLAQGYAEATLKAADTTKADTSPPGAGRGAGTATVETTGSIANAVGEFSLRLRDLCLTAADAQVIPLAAKADAAPRGDAANAAFFVTGVNVDLVSQQAETCTFSVKVTYGIRLPADHRLDQVAYTVFLKGKKRSPDAEPAILPRVPL